MITYVGHFFPAVVKAPGGCLGFMSVQVLLICHVLGTLSVLKMVLEKDAQYELT